MTAATMPLRLSFISVGYNAILLTRFCWLSGKNTNTNACQNTRNHLYGGPSTRLHFLVCWQHTHTDTQTDTVTDRRVADGRRNDGPTSATNALRRPAILNKLITHAYCLPVDSGTRWRQWKRFQERQMSWCCSVTEMQFQLVRNQWSLFSCTTSPGEYEVDICASNSK